MSIHLRPVVTACLLALATLIYYNRDLRREPIGPEEASIVSAAQTPPAALVVNIGGERWVQPLGFYATTISHRLSPGFFAGRRASVVVAALNVGLIFLVGMRLFSHWAPALVAALILIFMPAHYAYGRLGVDSIYVIPFVLVWLYALLGFLQNDRPAAIAIASAALGAGVYSTPSAPLTMAFLWLAMMVALWSAGRGTLATLGVAAGSFVAMLVPLAGWFLLNPGSYPDTYGRWAIFQAHVRNPLDGARAFMNTNTLGTRASAYWGLIDPSHLFFARGATAAPLLMVSAPLILAGIVRGVQLLPKTGAIIILAGSVIAPLAGSSFGERQYMGLALALLPFVALLAGYGADWVRILIVPPPSSPTPDEE